MGKSYEQSAIEDFLKDKSEYYKIKIESQNSGETQWMNISQSKLKRVLRALHD